VIRANRLDVLDGGDIIRFSGGVSMTVRPDEGSSQTGGR